jgi:hypothetical protein
MKENFAYREEVVEMKKLQQKQADSLEYILDNLSELTKNLQADSNKKIEWHDVGGVMVCSHEDAAKLLKMSPQTLYNKKKRMGLKKYCEKNKKIFYRKDDLLKIMHSEFKLAVDNTCDELAVEQESKAVQEKEYTPV